MEAFAGVHPPSPGGIVRSRCFFTTGLRGSPITATVGITRGKMGSGDHFMSATIGQQPTITNSYPLRVKNCMLSYEIRNGLLAAHHVGEGGFPSVGQYRHFEYSPLVVFLFRSTTMTICAS